MWGIFMAGLRPSGGDYVRGASRSPAAASAGENLGHSFALRSLNSDSAALDATGVENASGCGVAGFTVVTSPGSSVAGAASGSIFAVSRVVSGSFGASRPDARPSAVNVAFSCTTVNSRLAVSSYFRRFRLPRSTSSANASNFGCQKRRKRASHSSTSAIGVESIS